MHLEVERSCLTSTLAQEQSRSFLAQAADGSVRVDL
jgi:hypothetical protein